MARSPEHSIQAAWFQWARLDKDACCAFAVPNGGKRSLITAVRLKAEGVRAGVLDVFVPKARGGSHGLWIEFKAGSGSLTKEQIAEADRLVKDGFTVLVAWNAGDAVTFTMDYLRGDYPPGLTVLKPAPQRRARQAP